MIRTFKYHLRPNKAQAATLDVYLWRCRTLYNAALEQRRDAYRRQRRTLSYYDQIKDLTELRQSDPEFRVVPATILRSALKRLNLAYKAFFRRIKAGGKPGFPRFKAKDRYDSFSFLVAPTISGRQILVPKLGYVRFREYRPIQGIPLDATIRRDPTGKWWVSIQCNTGEAPAKAIPKTHVGVDVGLIHFATLSNGESVHNPRFFKKGEEVLAKRQQALALKKRGSLSRKRAKKLVAKAHARIHNQRLDFVRKLVVDLFSRFDLISYETLNIKGMVHSNLARSIYDASWGLFAHALNCKAEEAGKWAVGVDPRGTSQKCSRCGKVCPKTLSDRVHLCSCGPPMDRDHNAALNIDALGLSALEAA